jgi:translation initiation factor IF-1
VFKSFTFSNLQIEGVLNQNIEKNLQIWRHTILSKDDVIETEGVVVEAMPGATFKVQIAGGHIVTAYLSGKLWKNFIRVYEGDTVKLEISPYDLTRGRIIWRSK